VFGGNGKRSNGGSTVSYELSSCIRATYASCYPLALLTSGTTAIHSPSRDSSADNTANDTPLVWSGKTYDPLQSPSLFLRFRPPPPPPIPLRISRHAIHDRLQPPHRLAIRSEGARDIVVLVHLYRLLREVERGLEQVA
jgi:hypothetical protein